MRTRKKKLVIGNRVVQNKKNPNNEQAIGISGTIPIYVIAKKK